MVCPGCIAWICSGGPHVRKDGGTWQTYARINQLDLMNDNPYKAPTVTPSGSATEIKRLSTNARILGHLACLFFLGTGALVLAVLVTPADPFSFLLAAVFLLGWTTMAYALGYFFARRGG
jgi:hypothetical protein